MAQHNYLSEILYIIRHLFSGNYQVQNKCDQRPYDKEIPTYSDDRENLRRDRGAVSEDFKKAVKEKQLELSH